MELDEILPEKPEFTLAKFPGQVFTLRLINLEDHVWLKKKFGERGLELALKTQEWGTAIQIIYRLLENKSEFLATTEPIVDDDGVEKQGLITGPMKLLRSIVNMEEMTKVMGALTRSIISSNPLMEQAVKESMKEELKKNSIGLNSSTSLQANTAGTPIQ